MRWLIAGTGSIGERHIRNLLALRPETQFVFLRRNARRHALAEELGALVVSNFKDALDNQVDALLIATPSALHSELLLPAIAAGVPIYVEKPVVTLRQEIDAIRRAMSDTCYAATNMVGCNLRFLPSLRRMHTLVKGGAIGRVVRGLFEAGQWLPDWRPSQDHRQSYSAYANLGGGVVFDLVHELDIARWLVGEMNCVHAITAEVPVLEIRSEAVVGAVMRSESGAVVNLGLDYIARRPIRRYQLVGELGSLTWDLQTKKLTLDSSEGPQIIDCAENDFDIAATYRTALSEFLTALDSGTSTSLPLEEGLKSSELAIWIKEIT